MHRTMCKSKIHRAVVTDANLNYIGSITIDRALMQKADITEYEHVHVLNLDNGSRIETYAIEGEENSGTICLNGAAAHYFKRGDKIIIISYSSYNEEELKAFKPKIVFVDENNRAADKKEVLELC
ncbi:MAG: aspartate 1-decarboxylase [Armatimonadota bacterium]